MSRRSRGGISRADVTQMLIDGGYYRAAIRNLTEFDRIAGGLSWGILNSRHSIDVEFVENAAIRDKIRIAENICRALRRDMHCPHALEPHQIQGLDYPKLALVLEWLLKRVRVAREENEYFVKEHTRLDFYRRFGTCVERLAGDPSPPSRYHPVKAHTLSLASRTAAPQRVRILAFHGASENTEGGAGPSSTQFASSMEHAASILLEYGLQYQMRDSLLMLQHVGGEEGLEEDQEAARDIASMKEEERREALMFENLAKRMTHHKEKVGGKMSSSHMQAVMRAAGSEKLTKLREIYQQRQLDLQAKLAAEEEARNELENAKKRAEVMEAEAEQWVQQCEAAENQSNEARQRFEDKQAKTQKKINKTEAYIRNIEEIQRIIRSDPERSAMFDALLALLEEKKVLEKKIQKDHTEGKRRISEAKQECVDIAQESENVAAGGGQEEFEAEKAALESELREREEDLSKQSQEAAELMRKMDEFPTRSELLQFEVRITELNEEIAWKYEEVKSAFLRYNTRAEVAKVRTNEDDIFKQLGGLAELCMSKNAKKAATERQSLQQQTETIITQMQDTLEMQERKKKEELVALQESKKEFDDLKEKQQEFAKLVAELDESLQEHHALQEQVTDLFPPSQSGEADDEEAEDAE